jgi:hypothetical protein
MWELFNKKEQTNGHAELGSASILSLSRLCTASDPIPLFERDRMTICFGGG